MAANDIGKGIEKTGKAVGPVIARPFEQFANSMKDPWGMKKKAQEWYDQSMTFAKNTYASAVKEFHLFTAAFCLTLGFGFGLLAFAIIRRRPSPPPFNPVRA